MYGLEIDVADGGIVLRFKSIRSNEELRAALVEWLNKALLLRGKEISFEEYDEWRYNFTGLDCVIGLNRKAGKNDNGRTDKKISQTARNDAKRAGEYERNERARDTEL